METVELVYKIIGITVAVFLVAASFYGFYAIYYAYLKTKDEREKLIVLRSTAHAFSILLVYYFLDAVVLFSYNEWLAWLWETVRFKSGLTVSTLAGMTTVLGICLFINKRKMSGD